MSERDGWRKKEKETEEKKRRRAVAWRLLHQMAGVWELDLGVERLWIMTRFACTLPDNAERLSPSVAAGAFDRWFPEGSLHPQRSERVRSLERAVAGVESSDDPYLV